MTDIVLAFMTGLTTGGLSCLAVQGGLLATSVAREVEREIALPRSQPATRARARRVAASATGATRPRITSLPIVLFLAAKLLAYTLLGFLLGALGSFLQLTPLARAVLQLAIGIFMVANALRLLNVHPILRYFALEPPSVVTRFVRRRARQNADLVTPAFLGLLTVLIPCGVTQAMMALALGTGSPAQGAAIMFSFALGTSPVFFTLAYLAARLGARLEKRFSLVAAAVLLVLGLVSIDSGIRLTGFTFGRVPVTNTTQATLAQSQGEQTLTINVRADGYEPFSLQAKAGRPLKLALVTNRTYSCARAFVIPALRIQRVLPDTGTVVFDIPPQPAGSVLRFTCSMGMYGGQITFTN